MRTSRPYILQGFMLTAIAVLILMSSVSHATQEKDWHFNGTVIEACSCPMFCSCYFNTEPALNHTEHGAEHFCRFTMAYKINAGHHGDTRLAGVKFWLAGDLGASWKHGKTEWAVITFQPGTTDAQKSGVVTVLRHIFPVEWKSFEIGEDAPIEWTATKDRAEAKLAGGAKAHVILNRWQGMNGETGVFKNIAYFAAPRNNGFKMMPNEIETWKVGERAFTYRGTTGFMVTVDMRSDDVAM